MKVSLWFLRCTPGLSLICLFVYIESSLSILQSEPAEEPTSSDDLLSSVGTVLQSLFFCYAILLHVFAITFPFRLCRAAWCAGTRIQQAHSKPDYCHILQGRQNEGLLAVEPELSDSGSELIMAIVLPSYKEDIGVLEDTLHVLSCHRLAKTNYEVYLAMEARDPNAATVTDKLLSSFRNKFFNLRSTLHPPDIPGEAPGKSSNVRWAAQEIEQRYSQGEQWKNVLVTVMDSDTHLLSQYFEHIYISHFRSRKLDYVTDMTLYVPPIIFDRNAHRVPRLVRVADLMWCGAGLSCFQWRSTMNDIAIPTAVYTVPLALVRLVGGWDGGPEAIGEDMHMMVKCYFATNGLLNIESVPSPASQCNISTDHRGIRGWVKHHAARYAQGLRHMWGCLDTGFAIQRWYNMRKSKKTGSPTLSDVNNHLGYIPPRERTLSHADLQLKLSQLKLHGSRPRLFCWRNFILFSRLFEAHFLPSHLPMVIVASAAFVALSPTTTEHWVMRFSFELMGYLRAMSYALMVFYFVVVYDRYHSICLQAREQEMAKVGLHAHMSDQFSRRRKWDLWLLSDYLIFPVAGMIFGSMPLFQAAVSHFWTDQLVYLVSAKPVRAMLQTIQPHAEEAGIMDARQ